MKFAKELEQDLVPEWRVKYLDYKVGKKRVKAVSRAATRANSTPRTPAPPNQDLPTRFPSKYGSISPFSKKPKPSPSHLNDDQNDGPTDPLRKSPAPIAADSRPGSHDDGIREVPKKTPPMPINRKRDSVEPPDGMYGSFVPTPPGTIGRDRAGTLQLPDPAVDPEGSLRSVQRTIHREDAGNGGYDGPVDSRTTPRRRASDTTHNAYEVGRTSSPATKSRFASLRDRFPHREGAPFIRRMFSVGTPLTHVQSRRIDLDMVAVDQVRMRQREFFAWMDRELEKVEEFYKMKEDETGARLEVLRDQLHEMRNRRIEEVAEIESAKYNGHADEQKDDEERPHSRDKLNTWFEPVERVIGDAKAKTMAKINRPGANSRALQKMEASPALRAHNQENGRDYVRKQHHDSVPYRTAKRKLKTALQEFYRSMELLKSYALLNRVAFRKINKKYDKAVDAHPPLRYMTEKVNKSWFVQSDVLDGHMHATEDLYARYFERGNRKIATGKLRSSTSKHPDQSASAFRNGMLIGIGAVFAIQGVIYGSELLFDDDPVVVSQTSYLLQIYGGYFLGLYLFSWFCLDCSIWSKQKINYQFVFEYDTRHNLDWRQLSEFPSFLLLLLGLFLWLNFTRYGSEEMYIYYPVLLMFLTLALIFFPGRLFYYRSRKWFTYSLWRLFWAGIYPVEFRDFFLGDMFCSLTYLTSNISLFFCLYAHFWNNPSQCNSTHSRLIGFFSTLPSIWRAFQCLRRYYDTRNIFPHLVNFGKYIASVIYYMTLSFYRLDQTNHNLAIFITFATVNAIYSSIWDLLMDWSLLQPDAKKRYLRDVRGIKNPNYYYAAMILDPLLRFNWIFYALYTRDVQHSTICSFLVAFSEVTRRGVWVIFRVENEHCANVARFKASRDVPLPYELPCEIHAEEEGEEAEQELGGTPGRANQPSPAESRLRSHTGASLEAQNSHSSTLRRRAGAGVGPGTFNSPSLTRNLTKIVADAHTQDFEKKRKPGVGRDSESRERGKDVQGEVPDPRNPMENESSSDEDEEQNIQDAHALLKRRGTFIGQQQDGHED